MMTLKEIGFTIDAFPVELTRSRVLEYFEGDRLVEYRSGSKDPYFKIWSNTDRTLTRWFFLRLTDNDVARFLHGDRSLRDLLLGARDGHIYVVDTHGSVTVRVAFLRVRDIPPQDIPAPDSFYDDTLTPECDTQTESEQAILLNGEWSGAELGQFERRYTQVYAFSALFGSGIHNKISGFADRFRYQTFAGAGGAHVSLLDGVVAALPRDAKPRLEAIQLSSPGVARYSVNSAPAARVREIMRAFRNNFDELERKHRILDILRMNINRDAREDVGDDSVALLHYLALPNDALKEAAVSLSEAMGLEPGRIWFVAGTDVNSAELVANCYRRSLELYNAEKAGHAVLV
jgi:hypothetical protein